MKESDAPAFEDAVRMDRAIRGGFVNSTEQLFVHRSRQLPAGRGGIRGRRPNGFRQRVPRGCAVSKEPLEGRASPRSATKRH